MIAATVDNHLWGICCKLKKSAGIDHRAGWLKCGDGGYETFCTLQLARARANQLDARAQQRSEACCHICVSPGHSGFVENRSYGAIVGSENCSDGA
jgi:hypothetical protein